MRGAFPYEGGHKQTTDRAASDRPVGAGHPTFGDWAQVLLDQGYEPLPILRGQKRPAVSRWSQVTIDEARLETWARSHAVCGIGLRTGHLIGLDIDILDPDIAHAVNTLAVERLGDTLMRVGQWPKRLLLYRTDTPFPKAKVGHVEWLGAGQQFVAYGLHPATGKGYYWPTGEGPLDVPLEDLPLVTEADAHAFLAEAAALQPDAKPRSGSRRRPTQGGGKDPMRDADGRVVDGRDAWLSTIAFHAVHDALDAGEPLNEGAIACRVWERFAQSTDLSRTRKDGQASYSERDAHRKTRDKIDLHNRGNLPARNVDAVEPDYDVPTTDVVAARARLDGIVAQFCTDALAWHRDRSGEMPRLGIQATVGLGKSRAARRHLLRLAARLREAELPSRLLVFTATHALAEEAAVAWRAEGGDVAVLRGYERRDPARGLQMCRDIEAIAAAHSAGLRAHNAVCEGQNGVCCAHFAGCLKQGNRRQVAGADVVFAPYDALFTGFAFETDDIGVMLVDEACWPRALDTSCSLCVENFRDEMLSGMGSGGIGRGPVGAMADLAVFRARTASALDANGPGPVRREALRAAGLTAQDCHDAARLERWRKQEVGLKPGLTGPARANAFRLAQDMARIEHLARLWEALGELLSAGQKASGRVRIQPPDASGRHVIELRRVRPIHQSLRHHPILHLDATLRPDLAQCVLPGLRAESVEASAPHQHVRLITGSFGKSMLCPGSGLAPEEDRRRQNRLRECVDYVRWQALRHGEGRVLVITYKAIEGAFEGIPNVDVAHFNAVAGLDAYKDGAALITIGRPLPPSTELEALCGGYFGHVADGSYGHARAGIQMTSGKTRTVRTTRHSDARAELLRQAICDDELIQAIGRGRGVNRAADNLLEVHVLADIALPLQIDSVQSWDIVRPDIFQQMLLAGIATDSPSDAAALHPELFESANQAKKQFQQSVFKGQNPMYNSYREMTLKSAAYRRPGRGHSWQRCWWLGDREKQVRDRIERASGEQVDWSNAE